MPHRETLENIFAAYVNQGTLEAAARWMADNARADRNYAHEVAECLRDGSELAATGSMVVVQAVNRSGYQVSTPREAGECCTELLALFERSLRG